MNGLVKIDAGVVKKATDNSPHSAEIYNKVMEDYLIDLNAKRWFKRWTKAHTQDNLTSEAKQLIRGKAYELFADKYGMYPLLFANTRKELLQMISSGANVLYLSPDQAHFVGVFKDYKDGEQ